MRSWTLFFSAIFASVITVFFADLEIYLFLSFANFSKHMFTSGIEMIIFFTPVALIYNFICFLILFAILQKPEKIIELKKTIKIIGFFWLAFLAPLALDSAASSFKDFLSMYEFFKIMTMLYIFFIAPIFIGFLGGQSMYWFINKRKDYNDEKFSR
ncbi:hypothetical protein [Acinetobacter sp. CFCC 10889]|uniref:hypothetical protein n=1 Tax=Acinetobacter sp. CFCC 10889 TaxID=1775557 RepID=UPI000DCF8BCE|nr:hypothetical protein [Acinetobacter sp. CFCC 10889]